MSTPPLAVHIRATITLCILLVSCSAPAPVPVMRPDVTPDTTPVERELSPPPAPRQPQIYGTTPLSDFLVASAVSGGVRQAIVVHPLVGGTISSTWGEPRGRRRHLGIDLRGQGPDGGLGEPIRSMVRARVTRIGRHTSNGRRYGRADRRRGSTRRAGRRFPRSRKVPGYGTVYFFTRTKGSSRMGSFVSTEALDTDLEGHTIRYLHLGAVHPDIKVGDVVEAGQEIGLLGGTAVQRSWPHLHLDISNPAGKRVDPRPWIDAVNFDHSQSYCGHHPDRRR